MPHISFSELRNWKRCPFYHKLTYIDKIDGFVGNEFTAFGRAIHDSCEKLILEGDDGKMYAFFLDKFAEEVKNTAFKRCGLETRPRRPNAYTRGEHSSFYFAWN